MDSVKGSSFFHTVFDMAKPRRAVYPVAFVIHVTTVIELPSSSASGGASA
jgi:hypothetical protein